MPAHAIDRHRSDLGVAMLLAGLLTLAWSVQGWANLSALRLPDTDDAVRLQQIRDWLGGQAFGDLAQHRLGGGLAMHWSRLPDLVPAALIALLSPLLGASSATLVAVILWPAALFFAALALVARIARALGASGPLAALVAALAYPVTTLFAPGRIDHHGLQMVLLLALVRAAIGGGSARAGVVAGLASAASLCIGIETAPLLAIGGGAIVLRWVADDAQALLRGYALALAAGLGGAALLLRTSGWDFPACDGFTASLWRAAQCAALAPLALAGFGLTRPSRRARLVAALGAGLAAILGATLLSPDCLHPYGRVDPLLARLWLAQVAEAQPLFAAPLPHAIGYAGLMLAGIGAGVWVYARTREPRWLVLLALQGTALAITLVQLRGAYAGALLAAPALATLITAARAKGPLVLVPAWLVSAGLLYPMVGGALAPSAPPPAQADCTSPAALAQLATLPPGTVLAPIDMGAFLLAASPHRVIAAPYHRGGAGNAAMFRFYLGAPNEAQAIARDWRIDYVVWCDGGLGAIDLASEAAPDAFVHRRPAWLAPVPTAVPGMQLYRVIR
jgi:hypothetical protein